MGLSPEQAEAHLAELEAFLGLLVALLVAQGLLAALTVNALAALGEELG